MKNIDDSRYEGKPSCATTKSTLFAVSKDEWDTKEDTGKSVKNALYILQYARRHLSGQSKPVEPLLSYSGLKASVSQLLNQSVENSFRLK